MAKYLNSKIEILPDSKTVLILHLTPCNHDILIDRLCQRIGVTGDALNWFRTYLSNRFQSIHLNGKSSARVLLLFGVPQGSVLGPVLFSIYQVPLSNIAERHGVNTHLYADDIQIYFSFDLNLHDEYDAAVTKIEACLEDIKGWMLQNKLMLKLNDDKTELLMISSSRSQHKLSSNPIHIGDSEILPSKCAKNLGVIFDNCLKMDAHINNVCKNCHFHLRNIGKLRKYLTLESTCKVIHAFISSRLDYNNALLYGLPSCHIHKLQRIHHWSLCQY